MAREVEPIETPASAGAPSQRPKPSVEHRPKRRQGVPRADSIGNRPARIGVDGADNVPERPEQPDDEHGRAQRRHVLGHVSARHLEAETEREHRHREDEHVPLEREELPERIQRIGLLIRGLLLETHVRCFAGRRLEI